MGVTLNIAICGPIETAPLLPYLDAVAGPAPAGLGGTPVIALARSALEAGWNVTVYSLDPSVGSEIILRGPKLTMVFGPYRPHGRARDLFRTERSYLAAAIRAGNSDFVHAHWTYEFALGALESGRPTLVTAHDRPLRILRWDRSPYRVIRTLMAAMVSRRARMMTAVSHPVANHFASYFRCRTRPHVIPNGLDEVWFEAAAPAAGPLTFASVLTGWGPMKNAATLLEAFATVRRSRPDARLRLFGTGHGPGEAAERWALPRRLDLGVTFEGQISQASLRTALRTAHVLVHPSREESYSMVVAEAMAMGLPVIAAKGAGTVADTLDGGKSALLTEGSSAPVMSRHMLRLAGSPLLRAELGGRARESARRAFLASNVFALYADLYRTV